MKNIGRKNCQYTEVSFARFNTVKLDNTSWTKSRGNVGLLFLIFGFSKDIRGQNCPNTSCPRKLVYFDTVSML